MDELERAFIDPEKKTNTAKKPSQHRKFTIVDGDSSDDSSDLSNDDLSKPIIVNVNSDDSINEENESKAVPDFQKKPALLKGQPIKRMGQSFNSLNALNSPDNYHDMNCMEVNFKKFDQIQERKVSITS